MLGYMLYVRRANAVDCGSGGCSKTQLTLLLALKAVLGADCGVAGDALVPAADGVAPPAAAAFLPVSGVAGGPCCSVLRLSVSLHRP